MLGNSQLQKLITNVNGRQLAALSVDELLELLKMANPYSVISILSGNQLDTTALFKAICNDTPSNLISDEELRAAKSMGIVDNGESNRKIVLDILNELHVKIEAMNPADRKENQEKVNSVVGEISKQESSLAETISKHNKTHIEHQQKIKTIDEQLSQPTLLNKQWNAEDNLYKNNITINPVNRPMLSGVAGALVGFLASGIVVASVGIAAAAFWPVSIAIVACVCTMVITHFLLKKRTERKVAQVKADVKSNHKEPDIQKLNVQKTFSQKIVKQHKTATSLAVDKQPQSLCTRWCNKIKNLFGVQSKQQEDADLIVFNSPSSSPRTPTISANYSD